MPWRVGSPQLGIVLNVAIQLEEEKSLITRISLCQFLNDLRLELSQIEFSRSNAETASDWNLQQLVFSEKCPVPGTEIRGRTAVRLICCSRFDFPIPQP